jgi:ubiquinone/menaquinone biosynthesis C-methylase UbiE
MVMKQASDSARKRETKLKQYQVERELADQLRAASAQERRGLYREIYNEFFRRVPEHSQMARQNDTANQEARAKRQLKILKRFLRPDSVYLEVGAGDCHLAKTLAGRVRKVYAMEVSETVAGSGHWPANFELILSDGIEIGIPSESVHVAYSHMVMEHLHPEDAALQLKEIHRTLAPGGIYVCVTQHSISGPHDVSRYFDPVATGFHLKEYTYRELLALFRGAGFRSIRSMMILKGHAFAVPEWVVLLMENILQALPRSAARMLANSRPLRCLFSDITVAGQKAST